MPITACSKTSGVLASLQCSVFPKRHVPSTALPSGHPITHTEPSAHLGPPCTHPACHSTLREQRVPRGVKWVEGRKESSPYLSGGVGWAAHLPGAHLPAWQTGRGGCHSLVSAAIPPSPAAWPSAGQPAGTTRGDMRGQWGDAGVGCCACLSTAQAVPRPSPARSRQDTAGSGSSAGQGRSWPGTGHTCSPRSRGGRGRCCSRGTER